jgi:G:T-mismatch repair DNA endonuclease (very short patch repair protein)
MCDVRPNPLNYLWRAKIESNMTRDRRVRRKLRYQEYSVLNFWEHQVKKRDMHCQRRIIENAMFVGKKKKRLEYVYRFSL